MRLYLPAMCWAAAILAMATLAGLDLIQREVATSMLIVMPMLAFVTIQRGRRCRRAGQEG